MRKTRVPKSIRSTHQILKGSHNILHSLFSQSRQLLKIEQIVQQHVDQKIAVGSFKNNELTVLVESGALATGLRYRQRKIIGSLNRAGLPVNHIKIKVQPILPSPEPIGVERVLSPKSADQIKQSASHIDDKSLSDALKNLSKWGEESGEP